MRLRLALALVFCGLIPVACTTSKPGEPRAGRDAFGMETCEPQDRAYCEGLAGHTHRGWGPEQIEYIAPDGRLYLWIGDTIREGRWYIGHGLLGASMCYEYGGAFSAPNCEKLSSELRMKDDTVVGDPFSLATRQEPPFPLKTFDRRDFNQLKADMASARSGQTNEDKRPEG